MANRAGVRPGSANSIVIDFYYRGVRCRERVKKPPTPRNLQWAERFKARIELEISESRFDYAETFPNSPRAKRFALTPGDAINVEEYLEEWLEKQVHLKNSTLHGYRKIVMGRLIPAFGKLTLTKVSRSVIKEWAVSNDISPKTLANIISPLRVALADALEDELLQQNPLAGWKIKRRNSVKRTTVDPFSYAEQTAILAELADQEKNLIQFAFWTGMRTSELCALDWADIDWNRRVIMVSKALTQVSDEVEEPKTEAGYRDIKLLSPALEALQRQKEFTYTDGKEVFRNPRTGKRWTGDQPIRKTVWTPALKRAGVRYRRPYQTRHSYASMLLMSGENPMWVATQLGHTDWAFTLRTYSRFIPDNAPDAGSKAEAAWSTFGHT